MLTIFTQAVEHVPEEQGQLLTTTLSPGKYLPCVVPIPGQKYRVQHTLTVGRHFGVPSPPSTA